MKTARTDLAALILVALVIAAITVLTLQRQAVPEILSTVALVALGIGGGVALPRDTTGTVATPVAAVEQAAAAVVIPEQRATAEQPVATHAP